jgi:hypothetical protein
MIHSRRQTSSGGAFFSAVNLPLFEPATTLVQWAEDEVSHVVEYFPTAAQRLKFCQKSYFLRWLAKPKQTWRKPADHPWRRAQVLNKRATREHLGGRSVPPIDRLAADPPATSHAPDQPGRDLYRRNAGRHDAIQLLGTKQFVETLKSRAGEVDGMPRFLALFEHAYDLPFENDALVDTQEKVKQWLAATLDVQNGRRPTFTGLSRPSVCV